MNTDHTPTDNKELRAAIEKKLYERVTSFQAVSYEELADELMGIVLAQKHRWQLEAEKAVFDGGEKKFIQMLTERGWEYGEDIAHDWALFRVPRKTLEAYQSGELNNSQENSHASSE